MNEQDLTILLRRIIEARPVSEDDLELAQKKVRTVLVDAQDFGFSEAEVVKAILGPVWIPEPECGCPRCGQKSIKKDKDLRSKGAPL